MGFYLNYFPQYGELGVSRMMINKKEDKK